MPQFEVDVKLVVNADDPEEAFTMAEYAVKNMVCGEIVDAYADGVVSLDMEADDAD